MAAAWALENPARSAGLGVNLLRTEYTVLDFDHVYEMRDGEWQMMQAAKVFLDAMPATFVEVSASRDGLHVWLKGKLPRAQRTNIKNAFGDGTELELFDNQKGRYVLVTGKPLGEPCRTIADLTDDVVDVIAKLREAAGQKPASDSGQDTAPFTDRGRYSEAQMGELLAQLDPEPLPYENTGYLDVGMICRHVLGEDGLEVWRDWSERSSKFIEADVIKRWASFDKLTNPPGIGTLVRLIEAQTGEPAKMPRPAVGTFGETVMPDEYEEDRKKAEAEQGAKDAARSAKAVDLRAVYREGLKATADVLVPLFAQRGAITNVAAGPKTGKSTLVFAACVGFGKATPVELPGFGKPERPLRVLYWSENPKEFDATVLAQLAPERLRQVGDIDPVLLNKSELPQFKVFANFLAFIEQFCKVEAAAGRPIDIVVLDTFEHWVPDLDDGNSGAEIANRYSMLSRVTKDLDVATICILHTTKVGNQTLSFESMLGSTKYRGSADFNLMLVRANPDDKGDSTIVVKREGRDPWALVRMVAGRLPGELSEVTRRTPMQVGNYFAFDWRSEFRECGTTAEFVHMWFAQVAVPKSWLPKKQGGEAADEKPVKVPKDVEVRIDVEVLQRAYQLWSEQHHEGFVGFEGLDGNGWIKKVLDEHHTEVGIGQNPLDLPEGYTSPSGSERRLKAARKALQERPAMVVGGNKGMRWGG